MRIDPHWAEGRRIMNSWFEIQSILKHGASESTWQRRLPIWPYTRVQMASPLQCLRQLPVFHRQQCEPANGKETAMPIDNSYQASHASAVRLLWLAAILVVLAIAVYLS